MTGRQRWEVTRAWEGSQLDRILRDGWEPFAVSSAAAGQFLYHLRRPVVLGGEE